jgi:hypothetical protein
MHGQKNIKLCTPLVPSQTVSGILLTFPMHVINSHRLRLVELTSVNSFNSCSLHVIMRLGNNFLLTDIHAAVNGARLIRTSCGSEVQAGAKLCLFTC